MIDKVRSTLLVHGLAAEREPLWVAVSGGCDSMVLLHVLRELRHPVHVVHVDHGLRGAKSAADAAFVETHCRELGVPFVVERVDVEALVRSKGPIQADGRPGAALRGLPSMRGEGPASPGHGPSCR